MQQKAFNHLSSVKPLVLTVSAMLITACSSTPPTGTINTTKPTIITPKPTADNTAKATAQPQRLSTVKPATTPTKVVTPTQNPAFTSQSVQDNAALLDMESLDELASLLEATDMTMVENSALLVQQYGDLWERLRQNYKMNTDYYNPRIEAQKSWFVTRQDYINRLTARASRYLYHTVREAERRNIPTELALLPVIESSYDPVATSNAAAAGLWQFIPSTGRIYGLNQTSTFDGRRDVIESTRAAYDFLTTLYNQFGSWELALAAYNAGPGRIRSAINANAARGLPTDYWSLRLPTETMNYVPRFMAVAQIVKNPSLYNVSLPAIANRQHFRSVPAGVGVSLYDVSRLTGVSYDELRALNPALKVGKVDIAGPNRVLIPNDINHTVDKQIGQLIGTASPDTQFPVFTASTAQTQTVKNQTPVYVAPLKTAEPPLSPNEQKQVIAQMQSENILPTTSAQVTVNNTVIQEPPLSPEERNFIAKEIEKNSPQISQAINPVDGNIKVEAIQTQQSILDAKGQTKQLTFEDSETTAEQKKPARSESTRTTYRVKRGDTLANIASRMGVSWRDIAEWNQIDPNASLITGTTLYLYNVKVNPSAEQSPPEPVTDKKASRPESYTVKSGDTLTAVANRYGLKVSELAGYNNVPINYQIRIGQTLWLVPDKMPVTKAEAKPKTETKTETKASTASNEKAKTQVNNGKYTVKSGDTLTNIATRLGVSVEDLARANNVDKNYMVKLGEVLKVPTDKDKTSKPATTTKAEKPKVEKAKEEKPKTAPVAKKEERPTSYVVKAGDSLTNIAKNFDLSTSELAQANNLKVDAGVRIGQKLRIPKAGEKPVPPPAKKEEPAKPAKASTAKYSGSTTSYTVQAGDSLNGLSARYGISAGELANLNNLSSNAQLKKGQTIKVPKTTSTYTVKAGDTLVTVAKRYGISRKELADMNKLNPESGLKTGQTLIVPNK